ncbi:PTS fructose transporter subunit IIA [Kandleria sp.]|uniref:PTS sugar transporter subunit IIA n=1 Tax=Kandleria sp. TaxID=2774291 RepID=UPI001B6C2C10|nr:PTS fructose transporter subunit IIA [Kandleria sp.]MBP3276972.1 PTS fructose transporter subunit IIA [Kandleria sp.]
MKYLVLVSHGGFAAGLKSSLAMFAGDKMDQVIATGLENGKSAAEFRDVFKEAISPIQAEDEMVLLADIIGGSPLTTALDVLGEMNRLESTVVVGGMNLPMALTAAVMKDALDGDALATTLVSEATTALQQFKATAEDADEEDDI